MENPAQAELGRGTHFNRVVCGESLEILDIIPWPARKVGVQAAGRGFSA